MNHLLARTGLRAGARAAQRTQRRKMGDGPFTDKMHIQKNKFVEEWNGRREITEKAFEVKPKNLPALILTCVLLPYGVYAMTRAELITKGDPRHLRSGLA
ncbi:hypothetical protein ACHAWF_009972 [Thalassiosira exigua]